MSVQNRRKHDSDSKGNAVLLSLEPERSAAQLTENLGISKELNDVEMERESQRKLLGQWCS